MAGKRAGLESVRRVLIRYSWRYMASLEVFDILRGLLKIAGYYHNLSEPSVSDVLKVADNNGC